MSVSMSNQSPPPEPSPLPLAGSSPLPPRRGRGLASRRWWRFGIDWWWRSLPLRVVASVFGASVLVLVLGGFLLMQQATNGVMAGKDASVRGEARQALDSAQQQLNSADPTGDPNPEKTLNDLALRFANESGGSDQFDVIILSRGQTITAGDVSADSIPVSLRNRVAESSDLLMTPTTVVYRDGRPPVAGIAAGSVLTLPGTAGPYAIYFVFPLTQQVETLYVLRTAVVTTGAVLVILLTLIAALVARQVVTPVRAARQAAERLAAGHLDDRMQVRGQDDIARMAASMNFMASELQKQISQLEDLSAVQQRFVSDVSHELRTPLTTVRMAAEVLHEAREDFDPVAARSAELLQNELDRFESLLTDLLEISRFDAGAAVLSLSEVDLVDLVHRVVEAHAPFAEASGTDVRVHASHPCVADVDARRIERILRNLLVNAIEHGEGKPVDIYVEGDENAVAVAVRDHGVGFQANQSKQVFGRFWRADPARARIVGGTGLGLAISMEDANLHHGWLGAWGRPGMGAQFRLTVPRRPGQILESSPLPMVPRDLVSAALPLEPPEPLQPVQPVQPLQPPERAETGEPLPPAEPPVPVQAPSGSDTAGAAR